MPCFMFHNGVELTISNHSYLSSILEEHPIDPDDVLLPGAWVKNVANDGIDSYTLELETTKSNLAGTGL